MEAHPLDDLARLVNARRLTGLQLVASPEIREMCSRDDDSSRTIAHA